MRSHPHLGSSQKVYLKLYRIQSFVIIVACMISFTRGQTKVDDPFPNNLGPEQPKTTPTPYQGCPAACDARLVQAMAQIADLERRVSTLNIAVNSRLNNVPKGGTTGTGTATTNELSARVINVETYLYGNITMITNKLTTDLATTSTLLSQNITDTRNYLESRITTTSPRGSTPISGIPITRNSASPEVYANITARLDILENLKVQTLIDENEVWRKNFEVVNKTFSKMKKSSYSNEVIVVGK